MTRQDQAPRRMAAAKPNTFFGGAAILAMGILVVKVIGLFYKIPLVNIIGSEGSADFNNAYNIYSVLLTISTAGLPVAVSKMVSEANALGRQNQVHKVFRLSLAAFLTLGVVSFLIMYFGSEQLAGMMHDSLAAAGIRALAPAVICVGCLSAFRGYAQGHGNMTPTAVSQILEALCKLVIGLGLAYWLVRAGQPSHVAAAGAITGVTVGTILALATDLEGETVEDQVLQIDLESGEVTHIVDFTQVFQSYFDITRPVQATDPFGLWSEGEWDWLHLNSLQYDESDNSIIVSSRETSTIIKCALGEEPSIVWMAGNPDFWQGTDFAQYSLEAQGDFNYQYGQHDVELMPAQEVEALGFDSAGEGQLYLRVYDNNYYAMSSRDDFQVEVPEEVGTANMEDGVNSHVYYYLVDEAAGTFTLVDSFDVPYSSLVSNAKWMGDTYVVNNGVHQCYEEYDQQGNLIRQYKYTCTANGYRVMKDSFEGFWFLPQ